MAEKFGETWHRYFRVRYDDRDTEEERIEYAATEKEGQAAFDRLLDEGHSLLSFNEVMYRKIAGNPGLPRD